MNYITTYTDDTITAVIFKTDQTDTNFYGDSVTLYQATIIDHKTGQSSDKKKWAKSDSSAPGQFAQSYKGTKAS